MDNIFGIGLPEFILILVIAGMVLGPERIVRTAHSFGRLTARIQSVSRSFIRQMNAELKTLDSDGQIKSTAVELQELRRQLADLQKEVFTIVDGTVADGRQALREIQTETENSIIPPSLKSLLSSEVDGTPIPQASSMNGSDDSARDTTEPFTNGRLTGTPVQALSGKLPRRIIIDEDPEP